jgi:transposase
MDTIYLSAEERTQLRTLLRKGAGKARVINRARILLWLNQGIAWEHIAHDAFVSTKTIGRIHGRFAEGGLARALFDLPRSGQPTKLDTKAEAYLIALACSDAPEGRDHWTLELLQKQMVKDKKVKTISTVALWHRLNKRKIKPWREKNVVHAQSHPRVH